MVSLVVCSTTGGEKDVEVIQANGGVVKMLHTRFTRKWYRRTYNGSNAWGLYACMNYKFVCINYITSTVFLLLSVEIFSC